MNLPLLLSSMLSAVLIAAGFTLFSRLIPERDEGRRSALMWTLVFVAGAVWLSSIHSSLSSNLSPLGAFVLEVLIQVLTLVLACWVITMQRDTDMWGALYCALAGYIAQDLTLAFAELLAYLTYGFYRSAPLEISLLFVALSFLLVYITCFYTLAKPLEQHGITDIRRRPVLLIFGMTIVVSVLFELAGRNLQSYAVPTLYVYVLRIIQILASVFLLFMEYELIYRRRLEADVATIERMRLDSARQYELSKETLDTINVKFHDIRHQIRHLQDSLTEDEAGGIINQDLLADIAKEVRIYDASIKTGSETFDVLLTERRLTCEQEDIALSCICEGSALDFINPTDLYALFGNIVDNAIECVEEIREPEKRTISLQVKKQLGVLSIHIENYLSSEQLAGYASEGTTEDVVDVSDFSLTMKAAIHTVERYGGTAQVRVQDESLHFNALIPLP